MLIIEGGPEVENQSRFKEREQQEARRVFFQRQRINEHVISCIKLILKIMPN